jgi:hypothetical protein
VFTFLNKHWSTKGQNICTNVYNLTIGCAAFRSSYTILGLCQGILQKISSSCKAAGLYPVTMQIPWSLFCIEISLATGRILTICGCEQSLTESNCQKIPPSQLPGCRIETLQLNFKAISKTMVFKLNRTISVTRRIRQPLTRIMDDRTSRP